MRVAVLQRDPVMRVSIEQALLKAGHTCMLYDDGLAMSKALARSTVDLLVLDWQGTRLCGTEVLRSVRGGGGDPLPAALRADDDVVDLPVHRGRDEQEAVRPAIAVPVDGDVADARPDGEELPAGMELRRDQFPEHPTGRLVGEKSVDG